VIRLGFIKQQTSPRKKKDKIFMNNKDKRYNLSHQNYKD